MRTPLQHPPIHRPLLVCWIDLLSPFAPFLCRSLVQSLAIRFDNRDLAAVVLLFHPLEPCSCLRFTCNREISDTSGTRHTVKDALSSHSTILSILALDPVSLNDYVLDTFLGLRCSGFVQSHAGLDVDASRNAILLLFSD